MPKSKEVTGATPTELEVTDQSSGEPAVVEDKTPDSNERLVALEAELRAFTEKVDQETKARAAAEARALEAEQARQEAERERDREVKVRIGHQRETGPKLQRLSALEQQLSNQTENSEKLSRLEQLVRLMATNQLDPEALQTIDRNIEQEKNARELQQLRNEVQQKSQPQQQAPELTDAWKKQLKNEWFSEFDVNPLDLTDKEWHQFDSRDEDHWKSQVRAEFEKRHNAKKATATSQEDLRSFIASQVAEQVKAQREEDAKQLAETKAGLDVQRKELEESTRLAEEQLNRARGMDRDHESLAEPVIEKKLSREMAKFPPSMLYGTDEEKKAYHDHMSDKSLRNRIIENARIAQAKSNT